MRDVLDVNHGKNRIVVILFSALGILLFAAVLSFLIIRKQNMDKMFPVGSGASKEQATETINRVDGTELFPELPKEDEELADDKGASQLPPNTYALPEKETITLTFAGDVLLDDSYAVMSTYRANGSLLDQCIDSKLLEIMQTADVFMVNNEFPYTDRGTPLANKTFTFRAKPENVSIMKEMGVDIVSLANNHASDYGEISLLDTLDTLDNAGIPYVGAGRNIEEASKVVYFQNGNMKIGIVSATEIERLANPDTKGATETGAGTFRCFQNDALETVIKEAKKECDVLIVYVHWGTESTDVLDWSQPEQAKSFVAAGADVIIGDHPHVLQEIAYIDGVPVFYSLGNYWFSSKTLDSCLVTLEINKEGLVSAQFIPCIASGGKTQLAKEGERERILRYMQGISKDAHIDENGYVTE